MRSYVDPAYRVVVHDGRLVRERVCAGCGTPIPSSRRWCGDRCRRHTLYSGTCVDCGRTLYNGTTKPPKRCVACSGRARTVWTQEKVIRAMQDWATRFGSPPRATDWNPAHARTLGHPEKIERFFSTGPWPNLSTVMLRFGSWNAAVEAAGLRPQKVSNYGRPGESIRLCRVIRRRYEEGEGTIALAKAYRCSPNTVAYRIKKAGGKMRPRFAKPSAGVRNGSR